MPVECVLQLCWCDLQAMGNIDVCFGRVHVLYTQSKPGIIPSLSRDATSQVLSTLQPPQGRGWGVLPYMGYTGMCLSTGYGFCLSKSGTGSTNRRFAIPTLEHGRGYIFAARIVLQSNERCRCSHSGLAAYLLKHAASDSKVNRVSHFSHFPPFSARPSTLFTPQSHAWSRVSLAPVSKLLREKKGTACSLLEILKRHSRV